MEYNIFLFIAAIFAVLLAFAILYSFMLWVKYCHKKNLILDKRYLDTLFILSKSMTDASQGHNGDIEISKVSFLKFTDEPAWTKFKAGIAGGAQKGGGTYAE